MTTDELLNEMERDAELYAPETMICMIDSDTRTITVPTEYQLFGVEGDKKVERIYFQCPKIVGDNQDLSQDYQLFINYQNANEELDAYKIDDMEVDGDNITFSWLLGEKVTKYKGNILFAFGAIKPGDDVDDPDKNRWNTTINSDCTCLIGLESTQAVAESNPDALAQIWAAIDELKAGGGGSGTQGKDGREIELQKSSTAIQWRYVGDESWTDLVQLSEITGPAGPQGEQGPKGETGSQGQTGPQGPKGDNGITPTIGENGNWYLGDDDTGKPSRGEKGDPGQKGETGETGETGATGATPNIQIGAVQTLEPGQQATASMTGTPENPLLNLGIPKGDPASSEITVKTMQNTDTAVTLPEETPYDLYIFPEMSELSVTIADENTDVHLFFDSGATATLFSLQSQDGGQIYTDAYSIDANMRYEVSVLHNVAYIKGVPINET